MKLAPRKAFFILIIDIFLDFPLRGPSCDHQCVSNFEAIMPSINTIVKYDRRYCYTTVCGGVDEFSI